MFQERASHLLKVTVTSAGLLSRWEEHITPWPRVILYHCVDEKAPSFLGDLIINRKVFLEQISALQKRYRFLTWPEYKQALASPREAVRCVLLTFDDGFQGSWNVSRALAADRNIPAAFFINTRVLDNDYAPWMIQYYFLRSQAPAKFLEPLWRSISNGIQLSPETARARLHECFSVRSVVEPIEEGLAKFGMTPGELAQKYNLYLSAADISHRNNLITIGNHSHSHYVLTKLTGDELREDFQSSHERLKKILNNEPECFAYPFGVPELHFDANGLETLRAVSSYPYIFSAADDRLTPSTSNDISRVCLDQVPPKQVLAKVAKVAPRTLKHFLFSRFAN